MYKKALSVLMLTNLLLFLAFVCVAGTKTITGASEPAFRILDTSDPVYQLRLDPAYIADERSSTMGVVYASASDQRVVDYGVLGRSDRLSSETDTTTGSKMDNEAAVMGMAYSLCREDYDMLLRIVEAEASGEDEDGKLLVANVVLNRMNHEQFPDTVSEVILQQSGGVTQFSPVASGRIWRVEVSEETVSAVWRALEGEDISDGALYFAARKYADSSSMQWFDRNLTYLFTHGNHEFFR